jgi:hypothetical protein
MFIFVGDNADSASSPAIFLDGKTIVCCHPCHAYMFLATSVQTFRCSGTDQMEQTTHLLNYFNKNRVCLISVAVP